MARNGSGTFTRLYNFQDDRDAGIKIRADRTDAELDGIADALTASIANDGQTTPTANLPMGGFKHTGVADGSATTHYASLGQVLKGSVNWSDGGGTADAITASYTPSVTALSDGMLLGVRATAANATTTPTFAPDSLTAHTIVKGSGSALVAGDIAGDGHDILLRYDLTNTRWVLLNPAVTVNAAADNTLSGSNTFSGTVTMSSKAINTAQGSDIASATTTDIGAATGNYVKVTGTTTITGLGTVQAGTIRIVEFTGALTLTHNATSLILPGGANITTAAGDVAIFVSEGSGNWRCAGYFAGGLALLAATQAEMEAGSATNRPVTPGRQHFHKSAAKAHVVFGMTGTTEGDAYNVSSVTDNGTGDFTINFATSFSAATYTGLCQTDLGGQALSAILVHILSRATGSCRVNLQQAGANTASEGNVSKLHFVAFGDFA